MEAEERKGALWEEGDRGEKPMVGAAVVIGTCQPVWEDVGFTNHQNGYMFENESCIGKLLQADGGLASLGLRGQYSQTISHRGLQ